MKSDLRNAGLFAEPARKLDERSRPIPAKSLSPHSSNNEPQFLPSTDAPTVIDSSVGPDVANKFGIVVDSNDESDIGNGDIRRLAFQEACSKRSADEKVELKAAAGLQTLFNRLSEMDFAHQNESLVRKGVNKLSPVVQGLNRLVDIANPITSFEPAAASGLAIIKSVTTTAVAICGAEGELRDSIAELLNHIPLIDRYDEVNSTQTIHKMLILAYGDLLDFYFEALRLLRSRHFAASLARIAMKQENPLTAAVSFFSKHTQMLSTYIIAETSHVTQCIRNEHIDDLVDRALDTRMHHAIKNHNAVKERTDDACAWISADTHFQKWLENSSGLNWISLSGDMGSGKTVTAAYVVHQLGSELCLPRSGIVCAYYCRDDKETSNVRNIYCSLIWQLLNRIERLKQYFQEWYKKTKAEIDIDPAWDEMRLSDLLFDMLGSLRQSVFLVIDGLDECENESRGRLLTLFDRFHDSLRHVKLFVSYRNNEHIKRRMPKTSCLIRLEKSKTRDELIVKYWVGHCLQHLEKQVRDYVEHELSEEADGSAIWVRLVVQYLQAIPVKRLEPMKHELKGIPSPRRLAKLYFELFEKATGGELDSRVYLAQVLELLTVSIRPLSLKELACALSMVGKNADSLTTFQEVEQFADTESILQLAKAFISRSESANADDAVIWPVHQSLREIVQKTAPMKWSTELQHPLDTNHTHADKERGHFIAAKSLIRYLMLDDLSSKGRSSETDTHSMQSTEGSASPAAAPVSPPELAASTGSIHELQSPTIATFFDQFDEPELVSRSIGHGIHNYAIKFWAVHFSYCQPTRDSHLHRLAVRFYTKMSPPDWDEHLRLMENRPEGYPSKPDILTIVCFHGHHNVAEQIYNTMETTALQRGSALYWAASQGQTQCVELILNRAGVGTPLCYRMGQSPLAAAAANGHAECVEILLSDGLFGINEQTSKGRTPLSLAAAGAHEDVVSNLLSLQAADGIDVNLKDNRGWSPLFWAVGPGSSKVVSKLLQDKRTDANLLDSKGRSAVSWACEEGLSEIVKSFVANPKVDLSCQDSLGYTPLIYAIRCKSFRTVRALLRRLQPSDGCQDQATTLAMAARDKGGRNAISWAASIQDTRILELLLRHGSSEACIPDENGWDPLAWTLDPPGYVENAALLLPFWKTQVSEQAFTSMLSTTMTWKRPEIANLIIERTDVDVNAKSASGRTALSLAASHGWLETVKLLIENRAADPSITDDQGFQPLRYAQLAGHFDIVDYLELVTNTVAGAQYNS